MSDGNVRLRIRPLYLAILLAVSLLASAMPLVSAYAPTWDNLTPSIDVQTQALVVADEANGTIYIIGGAIGISGPTYDTIVDNVTVYDVNTGISSHTTPMPVGVMGACGGLGKDGRIYVFSGNNDSFGNVDNTQIYDIATESWTSGADMTTAAWHGDCAVVWPLFYVMGGSDTGGSIVNNTWIYDATLDSWSAGTTMPARRLSGASVYAPAQGSIYYMGGADQSYNTQDDVYRYDIDSDSWTTVKSMPGLRAAFDAALGADGLIYAVGGSNNYLNIIGPFYSSGDFYCPNNDTWFALPDMNHQRTYLGLVSIDSSASLIAVGGNTDTQTLPYVESLQVLTVSVSLSASTVGQGGFDTLNVNVGVAYASHVSTKVSYFLKSSLGTVYPMQVDQFAASGTSASIISISQNMPAGSYTVSIEVTLTLATGDYAAPGSIKPLTIIATVSLEQQIGDLQNQVDQLVYDLNQTNASLNAQLESALNQINALKNQNSKLQDDIDDLTAQLNQTESDLLDAIGDTGGRADDAIEAANSAGTYAMISAVLIIVLIVIMVINLLAARKK